jgi:hypothetical protein
MNKDEVMSLYMAWAEEEAFNAWLDMMEMTLADKEAAEYWSAWD